MEENKKEEKITKEKIKTAAKKFKTEMKKQINTALVAAFGFLIALAWRDAITEYVDKITEASPVKGKLISALIITFISVLGIFLVTRLINTGDKQ
jgi:hypothetical protein